MLEFLAALPECSQVAVPPASEAAMRYYHSGNILWFLGQLWSLGVPLLFLWTGFSGKLSSLSEKWGKRWYFTIVIYLVLFILLTTLLNFPLDFYAGFIREHAYGLSTQSFGRWLGNYGKGVGITIIGAAAFVWIFYLLLKKSPRRWWLYGSFVAIALSFFMMIIQPIWIDPLFNHFGPMKDKGLEKQILDLAERAGIQDGRVFEVDMSKDTNTVNAYVIGFGSTKRIVLWDTTLEQMKPDEILFVMGHEMGHYVLHHLWWSLAYFSALSFVTFYLIYKASNFLLRRYKNWWGFSNLTNIASVPLFLLLINVFSLVTDPLSNAISRHIEHEADRFGLEITQNNQAAAQTFIVLQQSNLANPRPGLVYKIWRSSHPPLGERIDFCNSYCPWKQDLPEKYGKYFRS
ncbi:MAG: M48 family metallopeptidase [Verrucomicrobia bacterium]|nr:M48 family metallopeptidase [Verrucomicrobiota bacterium]